MVITPLNLDTEEVVKTFQTDIDTRPLLQTVLKLEPEIIKVCRSVEGEYRAVSNSETTKYYNIYNIFQYTQTKEMWEALEAIIQSFYAMKPKKGIYVFQSWLNVYREGGAIHWHTHRPHTFNARFLENYHGFFCVNVRDTFTHYRFTDSTPKQSVQGNEGMIVLGKSDKDQHCTDPWPYSDEPRVTIAFDFYKVEDCNHNIYPRSPGSNYNNQRFLPVVVT